MPKLQRQNTALHGTLTQAPISWHERLTSEDGFADMRSAPFRKRIIVFTCSHVNLKTVGDNTIAKSVVHVNFLVFVV